MNILYIYYLDIFDTSSNSPPDFIQILDAPQGRHYFAFFWAEVGYEAQLYWLSLAKPRNKSRMRYPWNLIRGCGSPHVTPVFWGKIFGVKWEIFTFRGEKQKKLLNRPPRQLRLVFWKEMFERFPSHLEVCAMVDQTPVISPSSERCSSAYW